MPAKKKAAAEPTETQDAIEAQPDDDPTPGDIDERMAALLKDHQAMGARPPETPEK